MRKWQTVAAYSCVHAPFQCPRGRRWLAAQLAEIKPDYLVDLGDRMDADAASRHGDSEYGHDLEDEYREAAEYAREMRESAGVSDGKAVWCLGNHDENIQAKGRIDRKVRRLLDWNRFDPEFRRWRQIPYRFRADGCFQLGQVIFTHGCTVRQHLEAVQWVNLTGGHGNRLVVMGHTHRPHGPSQCMRSQNIGLPVWHANAGTMRQDADWSLRMDTSRWGPGLIVVRLRPGRACQPGRNWECELRQP